MMNSDLVGAVSSLCLVLLGGCSHIHRVTEGKPEGSISGQMIHGDMAVPNHLVLDLEGTRYEGDFRIDRSQNWKELRERYYVDNRKHWDRIFAGHDTDHLVNVAHAQLVSGDGSTLPCDLVWRSGEKPSGVCTDGSGKPFAIQFD